MAPMEGITDANFRHTVDRAYPEWSYYNTDFLRIPSTGIYRKEKVLTHFGKSIWNKESLRHKTGYQILAATNSKTLEHLELINELRILHLDLNVGCPSKKVNGHCGGAYLLKDLKALEFIVKLIREAYPHFFSVKIRVGYDDDKNFKDVIKLLNDCGADAITIHGRTRKQKYLGRADWSYIKWAVKNSAVPIIGNGDVWTVEDAINIFDETDCYSVMLGRGAMKTPWFPQIFEKYKDKPYAMIEEVLLNERKEQANYFFHLLENSYRLSGVPDENILKRLKALSRYMFDDFHHAEKIKRELLRSIELSQFKNMLEKI